MFPSLYNNNGVYNTSNPRNALTWYLDYPDITDAENGFMNNFHFYHQPSGTNFFHNSIVFGGSKNAKERFIHWYNTAVTRYNNNDKLGAFNALGASLHFLQDLTAPVHTAQRVPTATLAAVILLGPVLGGGMMSLIGLDMYNNHKDFEAWVDSNYSVIMGNHAITTSFSTYTLDDMANAVAKYSYDRYDPNYDEAKSINIGKQTIPYAADVSASLLIKFANEVGAKGFAVESNSTGYTVRASGMLSDNSISIPSTIHGKKVTQIATNGFANQTQLTSIIIPSSVTSIGSSAFKNCSGLTSITIPSGVGTIDPSVFEGCDNLTTIKIDTASSSCSGHTRVKYTNNSKRHWDRCTKCNDVVGELHNESGTRESCSCGYHVCSQHLSSNWTYASMFEHRSACLVCSKFAYQTHMYYVMITPTGYGYLCGYCGYEKADSGGLLSLPMGVLSGGSESIDAYFKEMLGDNYGGFVYVDDTSQIDLHSLLLSGHLDFENHQIDYNNTFDIIDNSLNPTCNNHDHPHDHT